MYKLVIRFSDGHTMPIEWAKGTQKVSVKSAIAKLLAFRLAIRERAVRKSSALPLRRFEVDFYINEDKVMAGIEGVAFSPKSELIEDNLNWLVDMTYQAIGLNDLKAGVGAVELDDAQAN